MTTRKIDLSDLNKLPRRYMTAKILEKRDDVARSARGSMAASLSVWQSTAPRRTGRMQSLMTLNSDKYSSALVPRDSYMKVVNSVNKRGKHAGFADRYKRTQGKSFLSKW